VLSIKAGGTGLNLTAASHVIHFDRWWNPAVENQATDRAYRIGQKKNVLVHKFICRGTVEEKIDALIEDKLGLSNTILADGGETLLTEMSNDALLEMVKLDINSALDEQ
jgi:non-specific serine/threonine protein kinase